MIYTKRSLRTRLIGVADRNGDALYDAATIRERRIAEAQETNAIFVAATRQPMARRFPAKPQAVRRNRFIRAIVCACAAFRREIQQ